MTERSYTVKEIDDLRQACEDRYLFGTSILPAKGGSSISYQEPEKVVAVEEMVRTYMIAGLTAEDLFEADREKEKNRPRWQNSQ